MKITGNFYETCNAFYVSTENFIQILQKILFK